MKAKALIKLSICLIVLTSLNSFGLEVHNFTYDTIKVKTTGCYDDLIIDNMPNYRELTHPAFLSINNVPSQEYFKISEKAFKNRCIQITSPNDKPINVKVKNSCDISVYPGASGLNLIQNGNCEPLPSVHMHIPVEPPHHIPR